MSEIITVFGQSWEGIDRADWCKVDSQRIEEQPNIDLSKVSCADRLCETILFILCFHEQSERKQDWKRGSPTSCG